jgi:hypothetical protein
MAVAWVRTPLEAAEHCLQMGHIVGDGVTPAILQAPGGQGLRVSEGAVSIASIPERAAPCRCEPPATADALSAAVARAAVTSNVIFPTRDPTVSSFGLTCGPDCVGADRGSMVTFAPAPACRVGVTPVLA